MFVFYQKDISKQGIAFQRNDVRIQWKEQDRTVQLGQLTIYSTLFQYLFTYDRLYDANRTTKLN